MAASMPAARISCQTPRHRPQSKTVRGEAGNLYACSCSARRCCLALLCDADRAPFLFLCFPYLCAGPRADPDTHVRRTYRRSPPAPAATSMRTAGKESAPRTRLSARSGKLPYRSVCYVWLPCTAVKVSVLVSSSMCVPTHVSNASESPLSVVSADVQVTCA